MYEEHWFGTRVDALIGGSNIELSNRLTPVRRAGLSSYNSATFSAPDYFYEFRTFSSNTESIKVMVDTANTLYNGTGPSTQTAVFNKSAGAGQTFMQCVANTLYFGDGVDQKKWMQPNGWVANTSLATTQYSVGTNVIDSNGHLQYLTSMFVGNITNVAVSAHVITFTFNNTNFGITPGMPFTPSGLSGASFLNGVSMIAISVQPSGSTFIVTAYEFFSLGAYASASDSGTCRTTLVGTLATTGASAPSWATGTGATTTDGLSVWTNFGNPVFNWAVPAPTAIPILGPISLHEQFWQPSTAYSVGIEVPGPNGTPQISSTATVATTLTSGPTIPPFNNNGTLGPVSDGQITWISCGTLGQTLANLTVPWTSNAWAASTALAVDHFTAIVDTNANLEIALSGTGSTGATEPSWSTSLGGTTTDSGITWTNFGPFSGLAFSGWKYGYAYHSVDGSVSTLSPLTDTTNAVIGGVQVQGYGSGDPQVDSIWIFRTTDGGATPLWLASTPNPGANTLFTFYDFYPDSTLNLFIQGPQAGSNNPPPTGLINLTYHLGRIFGSVGNTVYWSNGPDTITGNGNTSWPSLNFAAFPSLVRRMVPTSIGLFVYTVSDIYIILGEATTESPLFSVPYAMGIGLLSYNALTVNGTVMYLMTADSQVIALDPSSGVSEVGFAIGDQFELSNWNPANAYLTWHVNGSQDKALYVADGATGWFRMNPTAAPESGITWSPFATITGGCKAVQSVETSPGVHQLLVGSTASGPILKRDLTTNQDNGTSYTANFILGSVVLCEPGQVAELAFVTLDSPTEGSAPTPSVILDEVSGTFEPLTFFTSDPPQLPKAQSLYNQRFYFSQTQEPAICRHMQLQVSWVAENFPNELYSISVFGGFQQEM